MNSSPRTELRVCAYVRVSTPGQVVGKEFGSMEKQLANAKQLVASHRADGWVFVKEFRDAGITGTDDDRPELKQLMAAAQRQEFDIVVFQFIDRLSRHASYTLYLLERLDRLGIEVYDSDQGRIEILTPEGVVSTGVKALLAQAGHMTMVKATNKGIRTKASAGYWQSGPIYGYDLVKESKEKLIPNAEEMKIVVELYTRLAKLEALTAIVMDMRARGVRTKVRLFNQGREGARTVGGKLFTSDYIEELIRSPAYRGMVRCRYDGKPSDGIREPDELDPRDKAYGLYRSLHAPLVTDELWTKANAALDSRKKRKAPSRDVDPQGRYLLQGRIRCGCCKCGMATMYSRNRSGNRFDYYKCRQHCDEGDRSKCNVIAVPAGLAHAVILNFIARVMMRQDIVQATLEAVKLDRRDEASNRRRELNEADAKLADVRVKIANCIDAIETKAVAALVPDLQQRAIKLKADEQGWLQQRETLAGVCRSDRANLPDEEEVICALSAFVAKADCLAGPEKKRLVQTLIKDVTVFAGRRSGDSKAHGTQKRWRFLIRLHLDSLKPNIGISGTLPMQTTFEAPANAPGLRFRYIEPFEGIEVEPSRDAEPAEPKTEADAARIAAHPLMIAIAWKAKSDKDPSYTKAKLAGELGKDRSLITKYTDLLGLSEDVRFGLTAKPSAKVLAYFSYRRLARLLDLEPREQLREFRKDLRIATGAPAHGGV